MSVPHVALAAAGRLDLHAPGSGTLLLVAGLVILALVFLILRALVRGLHHAGFTTFEALLILVAAPITAGLNLVVYERGNLAVAVNVAGALIPILVSAKLVLSGRAPRIRALIAVAIVAWLTHRYSEFVPTEGVRMSILLPVAVALLLGLVLAFRRAPTLTYVAGTLGVLIGADLSRLSQVLALEPAKPIVLAIGGAGTLDGIFVVGIGAVLLQLLLFPTLRHRGAT